ncbi:MAG: ORF6N domain-containing protein [Bacteriovoracaceae bacterium]|nr:ORF6N domain-containing protein [Bacteriovoracaceae bacterium]
MEFNLENIPKIIYVIRNQKVMIDSDLALLYNVETKRLNEQVQRNITRFPEDFMFEPTSSELEDLRSQFATANPINSWNYKRRNSPMLFTEYGVAMLSSILNSEHAIKVNIAIMRIFMKLRGYHMLEKDLTQQMNELKNDTNKMFKIVFERLDDLETPLLPETRRKIGINDK